MAGLRAAPMVGREGPLAELRELAAAAAGGRPRVAVVVGEAGIGKTRLVDELVAGLERERVLVAWGSCSAGAAAAGLPLAPVRDLVAGLHRTLGPRLGRLTSGGQHVVEVFVSGLADARDAGRSLPSQAQLFDAVVRLVRDVGRGRTLLVIVEDVHWADETSRDLLEFLARSLRDERILLVLTARSDDPAFATCQSLVAELGGLRHGVRIQLAPLSTAETAAHVVALRNGVRPAEAELEWIGYMTGGVPLLVEEMVDADLDDIGALADLLLGHRLTRLSTEARKVVDSAAVAVFEPSADELAAAVPATMDHFDEALTEAMSAGVLERRGGIVQFRHALLREAAMSHILPREERELHRRWSAVLGDAPRGLGPLVAAAHHRRGAEDYAGAVVASVRAAAAARRLSAYAEQKQLLLDAAEVWPFAPDAQARTGTDLSDIYRDAAWAAHLAVADVNESKRLADLAVEALPDDASPHRHAMLRLLSHQTRWHGAGELSGAEVLSCVADVEMSPPSEDAVLACLEAFATLLEAGELHTALGFARRAVALSETLDRPELLARALAASADVKARLGEDQAALDTAARAVALADRTDDLYVRNAALDILMVVEWMVGADPIDTSGRLVEILGGDRPGPLPKRWALAQTNHAENLIEAGRWDEAQAILDMVLAEPLAGWVFWFAKRLDDHLKVWRGGRPVRTDDTPPAPRRVSLEDSRIDDLLSAHFTYNDIEARLGRPEVSRSLLLSVLGDDRISTNRGFLFPLLWVAARIEAELATSGDDPSTDEGDRVAERIRHLLKVAPRTNPRDRAYAAHTFADLERRIGADTPERWADVVDSWRQVVRPFQLATALVRAGAAHTAVERYDDARPLLGEAIEIAEQLGARPLVEEATTVARRARLRIPTSPSTPGAGLGLTPRELDVLRLVAEGASNLAIAEALVISPKTASVHVSNILAKLGVGNRGEAAAIAHRSAIV
jgi:DNA-binding CsgD family transcriptional regulator/tetratricopeptide (TPR) repeat protein